MINWLLYSTLPLMALVIALLNVATWRRGNQRAQTSATISLLIPARNEERHIAQALRSIPQSRPGLSIAEILVYDDKSTDSTRRLVLVESRRDPRIRLLEGVPLPAEWIGKLHALSQLADAAQGDILFFMDADVELKAGGVSRMASLLRPPARGRVVTAMPEQVSGTFFERLVLPLLPLTYLAWLPLRVIELGQDPRTVAANGQLMLLTKADYRRLGGFSAVRNHIVDDVAFCRHAKINGMRVVFADGTLMARCRMYEGARETWEGFSKNLFEGVGGIAGILAVIFLYFVTFLLPYWGVALGLFSPDLKGSLLLPAIVGVFANVALQMVLIARYRQPRLGLLTHPLSIVSFICIALNSWRWQAQGKVRWAGRSYAAMKNRSLKSGREDRAAVSSSELGQGSQ